MCKTEVMKDINNPTTGLHEYTEKNYTSPELAKELLQLGHLLLTYWHSYVNQSGTAE